jgi:hypothetical protein
MSEQQLPVELHGGGRVVSEQQEVVQVQTRAGISAELETDRASRSDRVLKVGATMDRADLHHHAAGREERATQEVGHEWLDIQRQR